MTPLIPSAVFAVAIEFEVEACFAVFDSKRGAGARKVAEGVEVEAVVAELEASAPPQPPVVGPKGLLLEPEAPPELPLLFDFLLFPWLYQHRRFRLVGMTKC